MINLHELIPMPMQTRSSKPIPCMICKTPTRSSDLQHSMCQRCWNILPPYIKARVIRIDIPCSIFFGVFMVSMALWQLWEYFKLPSAQDVALVCIIIAFIAIVPVVILVFTKDRRVRNMILAEINKTEPQALAPQR